MIRRFVIPTYIHTCESATQSSTDTMYVVFIGVRCPTCHMIHQPLNKRGRAYAVTCRCGTQLWRENNDLLAEIQ